MNKKHNWQQKKKRFAISFGLIGLIITSTGIILEMMKIYTGFENRLITSVGLLFIGEGFANWMQCLAAKKDESSVKRDIIESTDERLIIIRFRAGNRGFRISIAITYALLMWESLSFSDLVPILSEELRWYWLALAVIVPFAVYVISYLYDEANF